MHSPVLPQSVIVNYSPATASARQTAFVARKEATDCNASRTSPLHRSSPQLGVRLSPTPPAPLSTSYPQGAIGSQNGLRLPPTARHSMNDDSQRNAPPLSFIPPLSLSAKGGTSADCKYFDGSKSAPVPKPFPWEYDGRATPFTSLFDDADHPSRADSQEENTSSCDSAQRKECKRSTVFSSVSTCAYPSGSSNGSSTDLKDSPSLSYTAEQWEAFHELEEAEMRNEIRRLEMALAEERHRGHQLQQTFAEELMAQKDAHTRDITVLEDMLAKVMEENGNLSMMVRRLCAQVGKERNDKSTATKVGAMDLA